MVIFTDGLFPGPWSICITNSPLLASLGVPGALRWAGGTVPGRPYGFASTALSHPRCRAAGPAAPLALPPCSSTRVSAPSSYLVSLRPLQPCRPRSQAPLCPPVGPPRGCPPSVSQGCVPARARASGAANWALGTRWGRKRALLFSLTPVSAGFLRSANEHCVFTHCVLCSLTCVLQSQPLLVCGSRQGAG